jgi:peptidoglycan/LPS O-acetylase OafA/YrhL
VADEAGKVSLTAYRPFIDGLRAVSILAVVLYHVGVPGISGGYVGVDVFFVISGFLIISQIVDGLARGSFSFGGFWARRAMRILPPYLVVLAFSIAVAPFVLIMPEEFTAFAREARDAALMIVNHLFLAQQGYFDTAAETKVLLHLWSLSVEEQFYLVVPCLLFAAWWLPGRLKRPELRPKLLFWGAALIALASLAGCIAWTTAGDRNPAFYLTALRAWEFVAGGAAGFLVQFVLGWPKAARSLLGAAGLSAIIASAVLYTPETLYPSWRALLPVLGATAVIVSGLANSTGVAIRLLTAPPLVWIGLVSYSWYLWHWPLLAFSRIRNFGERDIATDLTMAVCSLGLAAATYLLIERPIRRWRQKVPRPLGWGVVLAGVAFAVASAVGGYQAAQAFARHNREAIVARFMPLALPQSEICDLAVTPGGCPAMAKGRPTALLLGDSQMMFASNGLGNFIEGRGALTLLSASPGCAAFLATSLFLKNGRPHTPCNQSRAKAIDDLTGGALKPRIAVLYSLWQRYGDNGESVRIGPPGSLQPSGDQSKAFVKALSRTIAQLRSLGVTRILVIGPTPIFPRVVPSCLYRADRRQLDLAAACGLDRSAPDEASRARARARIERAVSGAADVRYVDPTDDFCEGGRCLPSADDGRALFVDQNHPGDDAIRRIIERHRSDFDWLADGLR